MPKPKWNHCKTCRQPVIPIEDALGTPWGWVHLEQTARGVEGYTRCLGFEGKTAEPEE